MEWKRNWFSNMFPLDEGFMYQGIRYNTVENFYVAMKVEKTNIAERRKIAAMNPYQAKKYGQTIQLRSDWDTLKLEVMKYALHQKFAPGTSWRKKLDATTEDVLVEDNNWHDNYWGACSCSRCENKKQYNYLGQMLTQIRNEK